MNEILDRKDGRIITSSEAARTVHGTSKIDLFPSIVRLCVHEENMHQVPFEPTREGLERALQNKTTMLTAFFKLCSEDEFARKLLYPEVPEYYTWQGSIKDDNQRWERRKRGGFETIGRMYGALVTNVEHFHLRMLLNHVRGPTSYESLRTVDGVVCATFRDACARMGLLQDDAEWDAALDEASAYQMARQLRLFFAIILLHCSPGKPEVLWENHKDALTEDICHAARTAALLAKARDAPAPPFPYPLTADLEDVALREVDAILRKANKSLKDFPAMRVPPPAPEAFDLEGAAAAPARERAAWAPAQQLLIAERAKPLLNEGQLAAWDAIAGPLERRARDLEPLLGESRMLFVNGPAGTGKTFFFDALLASVRGRGRIALAVASSGIAAQLLPGGTTAHSRLKIPLKIAVDSVLNAKKQSALAELLRHTDLLVWDELPMTHKHAVLALDRTLRDFTDVDSWMGGVVVVFGGDFRQVAPVVKRGGRSDIVAASIKGAHRLWAATTQLKLTENMRARAMEGRDAEQQRAWAAYLLRLGDGEEATHPDVAPDAVRLPDELVGPPDRDSLLEKTFGDPATAGEDAFKAAGVLTPLNADVSAFNDRGMELYLPGEVARDYLSADSAVATENDAQDDEFAAAVSSPEFLNSLDPPGLPAHALRVKKGAPLMILRNICNDLGLANGTRCIVTHCGDRVLRVRILQGRSKGMELMLPRIALIHKVRVRVRVGTAPPSFRDAFPPLCAAGFPPLPLSPPRHRPQGCPPCPPSPPRAPRSGRGQRAPLRPPPPPVPRPPRLRLHHQQGAGADARPRRHLPPPRGRLRPRPPVHGPLPRRRPGRRVRHDRRRRHEEAGRPHRRVHAQRGVQGAPALACASSGLPWLPRFRAIWSRHAP